MSHRDNAAARRPAVGVDLGGTKIAAALVAADGSVLARASAPTPAAAGPAAILDAIAALAARVAGGADVRGLGLGAAGVIDPGSCRVVDATDVLPGWPGTDLRSGLLRRLSGLVPRVEAVNDVHAHALGEAWLGAGRHARTALLVAFGTGIGGSYIVGGRPAVGAHAVAGHVGHVPSAEAAGLECTCGGSGHLEAVASGPAVHRRYLAAGGDPAAEDTRAVFDRAAGGDALAASAIATAARAAGGALGGFANALDPHAIVVSGGLAAAGRLWWDPLLAAYAANVVGALSATVPTRALLGADAAVVGGASLILRD
ncbi:ROK family protein [Zhihengliuella salsuginis]|uniref:Transcriptional regulator n=1 Tax=Zhihengliuella salsuginis TaxID=578222 RepID=A0ABQ3GHE3_9MICC|nr:ROK family protein [Zhihengliuella salsuginis]GHD04459.1 transcriptional regulator [Zhihengliuella salsuginis]